MRNTPDMHVQSTIVAPDRFKLTFELSYRSGIDHALCRIDVKAGRNGEQLALWVGPCEPFTSPNELQRWSKTALAQVLHSINVEYFGGETF